MKYLFLIMILFNSCNNLEPKKNIDKVEKITKEKIIGNISILRKCGFGQSISIMRLTRKEQNILQDNFKWKFVE